MDTLTISKDPGEMMQHNAVFHQSLHCLLRLKEPSGTEIHHYLEISTCDPLKYKMGNPILMYQNVWENPSEYKGLKQITQYLVHAKVHNCLT